MDFYIPTVGEYTSDLLCRYVDAFISKDRLALSKVKALAGMFKTALYLQDDYHAKRVEDQA